MIDQGIPFIIVGDFNSIDGPLEKRGGRPFMDDIKSREFKDFLWSNGLVDLDFTSPRFT